MNLDLVDSELIPYIESIPSSAHIDWSNIDLVRQQSRERREQLAESLPKIDNVISTDYFVDIENERVQLREYTDQRIIRKNCQQYFGFMVVVFVLAVLMEMTI